MIETPRHINDIIDDLNKEISPDNNTIQHLIDVLHERGFGVLIFLFALPMAIPLPVPPGVNLLFSIPLLFLTSQQIMASHALWLPNFITRKSIDSDALKNILVKSKPMMVKLSYFIRPRLGWVTQGAWSRVIGLFGLLFALCVCIPVPLTNTVPSFAILLMALGVLMRDGFAVLAGMIIGSLWIGLLATLGVSGFRSLLSLIL